MPIGAMDSQCCLWFTEKHAVQTHSSAGQKDLAGEIVFSHVADEPHHNHPACGHKGFSHLSPVHALQFFIAMQVQHSYNSATNG